MYVSYVASFFYEYMVLYVAVSAFLPVYSHLKGVLFISLYVGISMQNIEQKAGAPQISTDHTARNRAWKISGPEKKLPTF